MAVTSTPGNLLTALLPEWHLLLQEWASSGRLTTAAQEALMLSGAPKALTDLTTQWSAGVFTGIPEIVLLSRADMSRAMGAYAISTGKIYLNQDWLATATKEQVFAVLTEELGHCLDGLLNTTDTPGDEGEVFSSVLLKKPTDFSVLQKQNDQGHVTLDGRLIDVEFANAQARSIQPGRTRIGSLGTNGIGINTNFGDFFYDLETIVGTSAAGEYLATPYSLSLAERYITPAGFDLWTVWKDANKTDYISLIGLNIEQISFNGTYVANNGGTSEAIPIYLTRYTSSLLAGTWGFKGGASNEIFIGQGSLSLDSGSASSWNSSWSNYSNLFVVAGGPGTDILFIPLIRANQLGFERNSLGLSRIRYTDTYSQESQYILSGVEFIDYIDFRYSPTNPRSYNLVDGTAYTSVFQASSTSYGGTSSTISTNGTPGDDLILVANKGYQASFFTSFDGLAGTDILLFDNWTRTNLTDVTRLSPTQWRLTFGGTVIIANNIEYLQFKDVAVSLNSDGTAMDLLWQDDLGTVATTETRITLAVSPASVTEDGAANLLYTFTRTGSTSSALTVKYTVAGTAILGTDYTGVAAAGTTKSISFAAGSAKAVVTINPKADTSVEANETVSLRVAAGTGYTIGTTTAVIGTIRNDDVLSANSILKDNSANFADVPSYSQMLTTLYKESAMNKLSKSQVLQYNYGGDPLPIWLIVISQDKTFAARIPLVKNPETFRYLYYGYGDDRNGYRGIDLLRAELYFSPNGILTANAGEMYSGKAIWEMANLQPIYWIGSPDKVAEDISLSADSDSAGYQESSNPETIFETGFYSIINQVPASLMSITPAEVKEGKVITTTITTTNVEDYSPTITLAVAPDSVTEDGTANLVYTFFRNGVTTSALAVQYSVAGTADAADYTGATPGTGKTVSFVAGSATAVVIVNPMADTSVEANETVTLTLAAGTGYSVGTAPAVIGSIRNDDVRSAISATLVGDQSSLLLTGTSRINGAGNSLSNTIIGNTSNNKIAGNLGKDLLTGGGPSDSDTFSYPALNESLLSGFDVITDYTGRDRFIVPGSVEAATLESSAGNVQSLSQAAIGGLLTTSTFAANTAKAFTVTGQAGTFVALNDNRAGFQENTDAIIFLRGFSFGATNFIELL